MQMTRNCVFTSLGLYDLTELFVFRGKYFSVRVTEYSCDLHLSMSTRAGFWSLSDFYLLAALTELTACCLTCCSFIGLSLIHLLRVIARQLTYLNCFGRRNFLVN